MRDEAGRKWQGKYKWYINCNEDGIAIATGGCISHYKYIFSFTNIINNCSHCHFWFPGYLWPVLLYYSSTSAILCRYSDIHCSQCVQMIFYQINSKSNNPFLSVHQSWSGLWFPDFEFQSFLLILHSLKAKQHPEIWNLNNKNLVWAGLGIS